MAIVKYEEGTRPFTNGTGATLICGDLVQLPDGMAGIVEGLAGVKNGARGMCRVGPGLVVTLDKASATVIGVGARVQIATATKLATAKVGAADANNFICGRAIAAVGNGDLTVDIELNGQGPTI